MKILLVILSFAISTAWAGEERCPKSVHVTADLDITQSYIADWLNPRLASPGRFDFTGNLKVWIAATDDCVYLDPNDQSEFFAVNLLAREMQVTFSAAYFFFSVPMSDLESGHAGEYPIQTNIPDGSIMLPQPGTAKNVVLH